MIRLILAIVITSVILSCSAGKVVSPEHTQAMNTLDNSLNYLLAGNNKASLSAYRRATDNFLKSADFCNMARAGILLFFVKPIDNNSDFIKDAQKYSSLGNCESENNIANFLEGFILTDNRSQFDASKLEEPYLSVYHYIFEHNASYLVKYVGGGKSSDAVKSMLLRLVTESYIKEGNIALAEKYINDAIKIDKLHSWSGNLINDYEMLLQVYDIMQKDNRTTIKTINLLNQQTN